MCVCVCVCVCVCARAYVCVRARVWLWMPEYVFADDGLLIRLCKRLILFWMKHQPDAVNKYIFHLCSVSTCFGQNIAHHQEINKMYKSAYGVRP